MEKQKKVKVRISLIGFKAEAFLIKQELEKIIVSDKKISNLDIIFLEISSDPIKFGNFLFKHETHVALLEIRCDDLKTLQILKRRVAGNKKLSDKNYQRDFIVFQTI